MACGINNTPRIKDQVIQIAKTLAPAPLQLQQRAGFIGDCVIFDDLSIRNPRTIIVDLTHSRLGHLNNRTNKYAEIITKGEWNSTIFVVDPDDPKGQSLGKHTAIHLSGFLGQHDEDSINYLISTGFFDNYTVNHLTGNVNIDTYLEATTTAQNNYHGRVLSRMAELLEEKSLAYYPKDAKRKSKLVKRPALKYPLSINEVKHVYKSLGMNDLLPHYTGTTPTAYKRYEKKVIDLIAEQIAQVWLDAHHYIPKHPHETYPLHDELKYLHQRKAVLAALEAQKHLYSEEYHADCSFYQYEEAIKLSA